MNSSFYVGIVEDRNDPLRLGRYRVRVFGVHDASLEDIPTGSLPWAVTIMPATSASISGIGDSGGGLVNGTTVAVFFKDGESKQEPIIIGSIPGIPVAKSSLTGNTTIERIEEVSVQETETKPKVTSTVTPTSKDTLTDTSGRTTSDTFGPLNTVAAADMRTQLKASLGKRESGNNYSAVNQLGYVGKYQMGAAMLQDLGYVKKGTRNKDLNDSTVWTGKDGISSKQEFLDSPEVQETAMDAELDMNTKRLTKMGVIDETSTSQETAGYLSTSHLLGTGGARDMKKGIVKSDANGVTGNEYYKLGYSSVTGTSPKISPENAVIENPNRQPSPQNDVGAVKTVVKTTQMGFGDPEGIYPKYLREQDTNRLARNQNISKTIVAFKEATLDTGVSIANSGATWDQSPIPFNAKYPFNHVHESESGHVIEIDDTPGNERIHEFHTSGTFTEIDRNGTVVHKIVGDSYEIIERNGYVHIKGTVNITIEGNANVQVANNCELEVNGNFNAKIGGSATWAVGGDWKVKSSGSHNISAGGNYALDSDKVYIQSGASTAGSLTMTTGAIGTPSFTPLTVERRGFEAVSEFETDEMSDVEIAEHQEELSKAGLIDENPIAPKVEDPVAVDTKKVEDKVVECGMFTSGSININDYISDNYRLRDLTLGSPIPISQSGYSDAQLACNLKNVAINILEPIKQLYPDIIITSGLRAMGKNPNSQHPKGMAVDMQFTTKSSEDYLEIARALSSLLSFDQLILEYRSDKRVNGKPTTWLHISFSSAGNRKQVFTMNNDKRISEYGELKAVT